MCGGHWAGTVAGCEAIGYAAPGRRPAVGVFLQLHSAVILIRIPPKENPPPDRLWLFRHRAQKMASGIEVLHGRSQKIDFGPAFGLPWGVFVVPVWAPWLARDGIGGHLAAHFVRFWAMLCGALVLTPSQNEKVMILGLLFVLKTH